MSASKRRASPTSRAATTFATNGGAAALSFLNVVVIAHALGPSGRGAVAFMIAIGVLTSHIAALSLQEANANLAGAETGLRPSLATNSVILAVVFSAAAALLLLGLVWLFPAIAGDLDRKLLWIPLAAVPLVILKLYLNFLLQADYAFGVTNLAWLLGPGTSAGLNVVFAASGTLSVTAAGVTWLCGQAVGTLLLVAYVAKSGAGYGRPDPVLARRAIGFGLKAHSGRLLGIGNYRADQWLLGAVAGSRELGLYSVAVAWAEMLFYISGVLVMVQRPDLVRATTEVAARQAARVFRVALVLVTPVCLGLVVAAPVLCVGIFGEDFRGAIDDLRVLALGGFGIAAVDLLGNALTARRRPFLTAAGIAAAFATMVVLNVILIPLYGGVGAAIASSVAWTVGGIAVVVLFSRTLRVRTADLVPRRDDVRWLWRKLRGAEAA